MTQLSFMSLKKGYFFYFYYVKKNFVKGYCENFKSKIFLIFISNVFRELLGIQNQFKVLFLIASLQILIDLILI
jgi:hypothetical protein